MVKYFKKLYIIYLIVGISGVLAVMYFTAPISWNTERIINFWTRVPWVGQSINRMLICGLIVYLISLAFMVVVVMCIFEAKALMLLSSKVRILSDDLEPQKFLNEFSPVLKRALKMNSCRILNGTGVLTMITHYSQGLFEAGRTDEAIKLIEDGVKKSWRKLPYILTEKCGAYCILCMFYYQLGEPEKLTRCSAEVKNLNTQVKRKLYKKNTNLYEKRAAAFDNLQNGKYDKAIEFYSQALKKSKSDLEKVRVHCRLAEAYAAVNNPERSDAHLRMALELGPELFNVKETQRRLQDTGALTMPQE